MSENNTENILATFRDELVSKSTLFLAPVDSFIERIIYFHIFDILKHDPNRTIVWLCLKHSRDGVLDKFDEFGFDIGNFKNSIWFIDVGTAGKESQDNTYYCTSRTDYTKMASYAAKLSSEQENIVFVIDDMTILASDTFQVIENFIKYVEKSIKEKDGSVVSMLGKSILQPDIEALTKSFFDVIIDVRHGGEMHANIGLNNLNVWYKIEEGTITFDYIKKKVKRDRLKILIVDDEPDIPELVKLLLSKEPYDFIAAYGGYEAIDLTISELPDLILLDIMMPDMDGYEVVQKLKKSDVARNIPIIMVSAKSEVDDKIRGMELGIDDYVSKPFDMRELNARIKMVMKRSGWSPDAR
ncbi:MAG TPA: response regulator [Methanosarcinaceae archaeon]|nr:response regulator [Methanosarcinaceae archaeon]